MTAKKRSTAKSKTKTSPVTEPGEVRPIEFRVADVPNIDGTMKQILAPVIPGRTEEERQRDAAEFVRKLARLGDDWLEDAPPDVLDARLAYLAMRAAQYVVDALREMLEERFGADAFIEGLGGNTLEEVTRKHEEFILESLKRDGPQDLLARFETGTIASIWLELQPFKNDPERLLSVYRERYADHVIGVLDNGARYIGQNRVGDILAEATQIEIWHLLREGRRPVDTFTFSTSQIARALQEGIIYPSLQPRDKNVTDRQGGKRDGLKIRTELAFDGFRTPDVTFSDRDAVLMSIQKNLLSWKQKSAALLKLHLDLTNAAYEVGGDEPEFIYRLSDALDRQGYTRHDQRRGHHNETMQGIRERLEALYSHRVAAWKVKNGQTGETLFSRTPYWIVEEFLYVRQDPIPFDTTPNLARLEDGDPYIAVRIKPGRWWRYADMKDQRIPVPASVLQLPTDGNGNERQRMALLLATYLAVHVRRNQKGHAGKHVRIRTGTLLEQSGYVTKRSFLDMKSRDAARTREYLHNLDDEGALPLLRELRAFNVTIRDEDDFFAFGRGWKEHFWNAMLEVEVPDLGLPKPAKTKGR